MFKILVENSDKIVMPTGSSLVLMKGISNCSNGESLGNPWEKPEDAHVLSTRRTDCKTGKDEGHICK